MDQIRIEASKVPMRVFRSPPWAVRDLLFHLLCDAQRALVALDTPAAEAADRNAVTYRTDAPAGHDDPQSRQVRALRTMASARQPDFLTITYAETTAAVAGALRRS